MLDAAKAMKLSAKDLLELQIIDEIVKEPLGGAHRDRNLMLQNVKESITKNLDYFKTMSSEEVFNDRKNKYLRIGRNKGFMSNLDDLSSLKTQNNTLDFVFEHKRKIMLSVILIFIVFFLTFLFL